MSCDQSYTSGLGLDCQSRHLGCHRLIRHLRPLATDTMQVEEARLLQLDAESAYERTR